MKCWKIRFRKSNGMLVDIYVQGETMYKALYNYQVFAVVSCDLVGDAG